MAFLFGVAAREELPGPVLHQLLGDLGWSVPAARALVARMRADGQIASTRRGRIAAYRLDGRFADAFRRVRDAAIRPPTPWSGAFHAVLYQVPEPDRPFRDLLRRTALFSGYGLLQQGILIALTDRAHALADVLAQQPAGASVYLARLEMSTADAARAAREAWQLDAVASRYERHVATLTTALAELPADPPPAAETLRTFAELIQVPATETLYDPGLPPELLPPRWPGTRLHAARGQVGARLGPPAHRYLTGLIG